jgi:hypothetical protein
MKGPKPRPVEERFWEKVVKSDTCWNWIGGKFANGYGSIGLGVDRIIISAHRLSWQLHFGQIPVEMHVCHHCDNRACVNPAHLFLGTPADNVADCVRKGRIATRERVGSHKLTEEEVDFVGRSGETQTALAERFGVHQSTISDVVTGVTWKQ